MYYVGSMAYDPNYLEHHGIKGQKWGVRKYQNPDGTLTAAGKARYYQLSDGSLKSKIKYEQKDDGSFKKRGLLSRSVMEGKARMTKTSGKDRGLISAGLRAYGATAVRSMAKSGVLAAAIVGSTIAAPGAAVLISTGASVAGTIMGIRETARFAGNLYGSVSEWDRRRNSN